MNNVRKPRVYLAGPDVFFHRAGSTGERLKKFASDCGLEGIYPLDAELELVDVESLVRTHVESKRENARRIREANMAMIRSADAVCANVLPFRGPSADVGTAWEMGYATALGKPVASYSYNVKDYADRVLPDNFRVEDFSLHDNLMLAGAEHSSTYEEAIDWIAWVFKARAEEGKWP
jgi:nucleoside 2-deoxyribosyltransferase